MSVSENASENEKISSTIFHTPFPDPINGKLNTLQFLEASKGIVSLLGKISVCIILEVKSMFMFVIYSVFLNELKLTQIYIFFSFSLKFLRPESRQLGLF